MNREKIIINPKFKHLAEFVKSIPTIFDREGECIYDMRNRIKVFDVEGFKINVKRYCIPPLFFNRIIYNIFRKPKAERAYLYAHKLQEMGFSTPTPIAYIIHSGRLLLDYSYLITVQESYTYDIGDFIGKEELDKEDRKVLSSFGEFTAKLHEKGIFHSDYGEGNILFNKVDGEPIFSLIDINRMTFDGVSIKRGCNNFSRLKMNSEMFQTIAKSYAEARGCDEDMIYEEIMHGKQSYRNKMKLKRVLKLKFK